MSSPDRSPDRSPGTIGVRAALVWAQLEGEAPRLLRDATVELERDSGKIVRIHPGPHRGSGADEGPERAGPELVYDLGHSLLLPGLVNAHSHAFQRTIRGATHRRGAGDPSSFWSWRKAMYAAANALDPEAFEEATRDCFAEMLARGITCVGEFHYVHHQADGRPYADPNELSRRVIAAAEAVGLRLCLLEVYYSRAGVGQEGPLPEQRRFCDGSVEAYLARLDELRRLAGTRPDWLSLGVTPHSIRALRRAELDELAAYANEHALPIHAHVSEQPLENEQCRAEHGASPLAVFADAGCLARPGAFTAVHAIHVEEADLARMKGQQICACPTTEADLGDGIVPAVAWRRHGAELALGSDSNAIIDLIQEARLLEMDERLEARARLRLHDEEGRVAPVLLAAATTGGARALARPELGRLAPGSPFDAIVVDLDHWLLRGIDDELILDALLTTGTAEPITQVWVGGRRKI